MIFGREATLLIDLVNPARKVDKSQSRSNADDITELTKRLKMAHESAFVYLFGVLRRFQHCTGHITTGSWKGRENQYIEFARVVYCKLPTDGKQLPAFPLTTMTGIEPRPQRWEARVLPLCHRGPHMKVQKSQTKKPQLGRKEITITE